MLLQHLSAIPNRQVPSLLLPGPNLRFSLPTRILIQLVIGFHVWPINHIQVADIQGALFKEVKKLQTATSGVPCRNAEIQAMPIGFAFLLRTIYQTFQTMKE